MRSFPQTKILFGLFGALLVPIGGVIFTDAPWIWPVSILTYNLGLLAIVYSIRQKVIRVIVFNVFATLFFVIESCYFFSFYLQDKGFNEAFFYHIRPDLIYAGVGEHFSILLIMVACLCVYLIALTASMIGEKTIKIWKLILGLALFLFGLFISPPAKDIVAYFNRIPVELGNSPLYKNLTGRIGSDVSIEFKKTKRPNVVLIYAESVEQRYFDESIFPGLAPNLSALKEQSIDFSNVSQGFGAGWTVAGLVASQCGTPLAGFQGVYSQYSRLFDKFLPRAICLGDLLKNDGYYLSFIGGADPRYAGKGDFLRSHGYTEVLGRDHLLQTLSDQSYRNEWGVFDDTLLDFAIERFYALSTKDAPFLLTLLTLDTHHPTGFLSNSCSVYKSGTNSSLNSINCSDQLISDFIKRVRNSTYSKNTIIVVLSDHLAMRNQASQLLTSSSKPDRLTFFINTGKETPEQNNNPGTHYDISPTILDVMGYAINGQIGLGAPLAHGKGYLPGKFGSKWHDLEKEIMAAGKTLWDNKVRLGSEGISLDSSSLILSLGGRRLNVNSIKTQIIPASTLIFFDEKSLRLEDIILFPLDKGVTPSTLSKELMNHNNKLALAISRAGNLGAFFDRRTHPDTWVVLFGRPGSKNMVSWPLTGDISIPFDTIRALSQEKTDSNVTRTRNDTVRILELSGR